MPEQGCEQKPGLSPNDPVSEILNNIIFQKKNILLVGHLPFLQKMVSLALLDAESQAIIKFCMAGIVCLEYDEEGVWTLIFEVISELLP